MEASLKSGVQKLADRFSWVHHPRNLGTVAAIDCQLTEDRALFKLSQLGFENNLTIRPLHKSIYLYLPLVTTTAECNDIFNRLENVLNHFD